jgi:putative MATE family efflux protein
MKYHDLFESMPVPKAIAMNAIPAIISMLVVLLYNIADTFFVGQTGDPMQVAAVSLATPVFLLFMATGTLFGIGGTSLISRAFGAGRAHYAKQASSFCFYASLGTGIIYIFLFWLFMPFILSLVGTSPGTIGFTRDYLMYVAPSAPFVIIANAFSNIVKAEGKAKEAMLGMMLGTVINIIFDPIMIIGLQMGVKGAAVATVIGNIVGTGYYLLYFYRGHTSLSIAPKDFRIRGKIMSGVLAIGIPAALNNIMMSASSIVLNNFLATYGDIQVAAMGVAVKVGMIVVLLQIGLGQGIQPLLGYSYGAKNRNALRRFYELPFFIQWPWESS